MRPAYSPILSPIYSAIRSPFDTRRGGGASWSPLSLFAVGEQGGWYDPTDLTTMFQDSAGTTPVTAVEQPVGLWLDKRLGALSALGSNIVVNGDFASPSGWLLPGFWGIGGGVATASGAGNGYIYRTLGALAGSRVFRVTFDVVSRAAGSVQAYVHNGSAGVFTPAVSAVGTHTFVLVHSGVNELGFLASSFNGAVDNLQIQEILGNHLIQPTSASRPTYSKRYNVLERTQEFANAYWDKTRTTVSSATDPSGGLTAWKLVNDTTPASSHQIRRTVTVVSGQSYTVRFLAKAAEYSFVRFWEDATTGNQCYFDLVNGVATNAGVSSCSMSSAGNGWWVCTAVLNNFGGTALGYRINLTPDGVTTNYNGDGVSGVFLSWPDLRRTIHTTMGMPAYQRVTTATDYDETGFLPRLRFDGADDSMYTAASVNFTATDEMTVLAGLTKLSDAATGIAVESADNSTIRAGAFGLFAPATTGANSYRHSSQNGTAPVGTGVFAAAPNTSVLTTLTDISAPVNTLRRNGALQETSTVTQGAGSFGNWVLFVGRRNNASLPFNGDIFQLIVRGALTSGAELTSAEQYVAQRTGATL